MSGFLRVAVLVFAASTGFAAGPGPQLADVCEVIRNPASFDGRDLVLAGRIEKRDNGRFAAQDGCEGASGPQRIVIRLERASAPMPPESFSLNKDAVNRKFNEIRRNNALQEFKFGSGAYDRWGMIFGRYEKEQGVILCRGDALIFFWEP